jgi:glycosyltransferase involved in cell wall biosynthesis
VIREKPRPLRRRPTVSVVVPCYNYGHFLPECVASALAQEGVDVQVLIVDDASPDGSAVVARRLAANDSRVRMIENRENRGHIATYNVGLAEATGDYVVLLSADDLLARDALTRSAALLEEHPEVVMVSGYAVDFVDRPPPPKPSIRNWTIWPGPEWIGRVCERGQNLIACPEVVLRAATMRELVGYDPRLPHTADFYLWLRAATRGAVGRINGCDQAYYRVHGNNMHLREFAGVFTDITERRLTFEMFFQEDGARLQAPERRHQAARRAMAREALRLACRSLDQGDESTSMKLADFAADTFPRAALGRSWHRYERRARWQRRGGRRPLGDSVRAISDDLADRIRWRRWRRFGI